MSQHIRRRLAELERLDPSPRSEDERPQRQHIRRFSEGLERAVLDRLRTPRVRRFSDGTGRTHATDASKNRVGRFSHGQEDGRGDELTHQRVGALATRAALPAPPYR